MNLMMSERSSHPSRAQVVALLEFLEAHPTLAKGFAKVASAREAARKHWERLTVQLNGMGGSEKTWKQWNKYWADKKSAVKKKTTLHFAAPPRVDGVDEIELTDLEHRILALMTGGNCVANKQLFINPFSDYVEESSNHNFLSSAAAQQPASLNARVEKMKPSENVSLADNSLLEQSAPSMEGVHPSAPHSQGMPNCQRPHSTHRSTVAAQWWLNQWRGWTARSSDPPTSPTTTVSYYILCPMYLAVPRRRRKPTPQSQRLSEFNQITDRFLRLKEKRLHQNHRNVQLLEGVNTMAEKQLEAMNAIARGLDAIGEGLKMLADSNKCKNCVT